MFTVFQLGIFLRVPRHISEGAAPCPYCLALCPNSLAPCQIYSDLPELPTKFVHNHVKINIYKIFFLHNHVKINIYKKKYIDFVTYRLRGSLAGGAAGWESGQLQL